MKTIGVRSSNHQPQLQHSGKSSGTPSQQGDTRRKEHHGSTSLEQVTMRELPSSADTHTYIGAERLHNLEKHSTQQDNQSANPSATKPNPPQLEAAARQ